MKTKAKRAPAKRGSTAVVKAGLPKKAAEGVRAITAVDPQALLAQAIDKGMPVESMERLLAMRREMKAEWAKEQYFKALAGFQHECPVIEKVKKVSNKEGKKKYTYAPIEDIVAGVKELLEKWGFSFTFKSRQEDGFYTSICIAHHKDGHEEPTEFKVPTIFPEYMNMSGPQEQGAACTYADRYAFKNAFGIVTKGDDSDAVRPEEGEGRQKPIQKPQEKKAGVPAQGEMKRAEITDYEKILLYIKTIETDPKTSVTYEIFSQNEQIDYTHEAKEAEKKPEVLKTILADIVATIKKRHAAVKGEA